MKTISFTSSQNITAKPLCIALALAGIVSIVWAQPALAKHSAVSQSLSLHSEVCEDAPCIVHNFQKVSEGIWRGAAPSDDALQSLAKQGVKTIVDLRMEGSGVERESSKAKELGIQYHHFPLGFNKPSTDQLRSILSIMTNPVHQPVFVHCRQGADRTGMLVGIYRRLWSGWTFSQTWHEMRQHHFKPFLSAMKKEVKAAPVNDELQPMKISSIAGADDLSAQLELADNNTDKANLIVSRPVEPPK